MKVFLDSVGCRLNQSEIEKMALQFRSAGHEIVDSAAAADLVVVNTCSVTTSAESDSRQKIRKAHRTSTAAIAVTGCWATLDNSGANSLPGVEWVVSNADKEKIVANILQIPLELMDLEPLARSPLPGNHLRTRAFIKVQDGCDNHCTFCVTRLARGTGRSVPSSEVLKDIRHALDGGAKEVVLTGVHLGSWGRDFDVPLVLENLIESILKLPEQFRLRLSSLEPWDLDKSFFQLWKDNRMCRHLHLPLQSGSEATLRRMGRKITPGSFLEIVDAARSAVPEIALTTDIITGFPGESNEEFEESLEFTRRLKFAGGHVFSYSPRPGTPAARYHLQVPMVIRKQRNAQFRELFADSSLHYREQFIGELMPVLWEASSCQDTNGWVVEGLTDNYIRVSAASPERKWNEMSLVKLVSLQDDLVNGVIQANGL